MSGRRITFGDYARAQQKLGPEYFAAMKEIERRLMLVMHFVPRDWLALNYHSQDAIERLTPRILATVPKGFRVDD